MTTQSHLGNLTKSVELRVAVVCEGVGEGAVVAVMQWHLPRLHFDMLLDQRAHMSAVLSEF